MSTYSDMTDAGLRALTRLRRAERQATPKPCVRAAATGRAAEFEPRVAMPAASSARSKVRMQAWRRREWKAGVRSCFYCSNPMTQIPKHGAPPPSSVTVGHRIALANGGADDPVNYVMCCSQCNNRKGSMSEGEYRAVLAKGQVPETTTAEQQPEDQQEQQASDPTQAGHAIGAVGVVATPTKDNEQNDDYQKEGHDDTVSTRTA